MGHTSGNLINQVDQVRRKGQANKYGLIAWHGKTTGNGTNQDWVSNFEKNGKKWGEKIGTGFFIEEQSAWNVIMLLYKSCGVRIRFGLFKRLCVEIIYRKQGNTGNHRTAGGIKMD